MPTRIFTPTPGHGKTEARAEIIAMRLREFPRKEIAILAPTEEAVRGFVQRVQDKMGVTLFARYEITTGASWIAHVSLEV